MIKIRIFVERDDHCEHEKMEIIELHLKRVFVG